MAIEENSKQLKDYLDALLEEAKAYAKSIVKDLHVREAEDGKEFDHFGEKFKYQLKNPLLWIYFIITKKFKDSSNYNLGGGRSVLEIPVNYRDEHNVSHFIKYSNNKDEMLKWLEEALVRMIFFKGHEMYQDGVEAHFKPIGDIGSLSDVLMGKKQFSDVVSKIANIEKENI